MHPETVYLNGQYLSKDKAFISPEDRGFYFADGVYEVVKYYNGRPFRFEDHLKRLQNSLSSVRIVFNDLDQLIGVCDKLIDANGFKNLQAGVYIQITRGVAIRSHCFPKGEIMPTVYIRSFAMPSPTKDQTDGIKVITHEDIRWHCCNIKSIALLPNTMIFQKAVEQGAGECFLVRDGFLTEATHSNLMAVKDDKVLTHPDSNLILPGITKGVVLNLCTKLGIEILENPIKATEINTLDEFFITGTGSEVMPVIQIDGKIIGDGLPGPVTRKLQNDFNELTKS